MTKIYISPSSQEANIGPGGYVEEVYMNKVADVLIPLLQRHGLDVARNLLSNKYYDHVRESNAWGADYHIAIHSNASASHAARGCTIFCYDANNPARAGTRLANEIYNKLSPVTPTTDRGVRSSTMDEVEKTKCPAVLIEVDFHDNAEGAAWITANIENIARAILYGILAFLEIAYIPDPVEDTTLYKVQVGAFRIRFNAEAYRNKIVAAGFPGAYIVMYKDVK